MIKFYANSNILVVGATSSGKTTTVLKIIKQKLIEPWPQKIFYLFGAKQDFMDSWNRNKENSPIEFISGLELGVLEKFSGPKLLIIDDLCLSQNKDLTNHFIRGVIIFKLLPYTLATLYFLTMITIGSCQTTANIC